MHSAFPGHVRLTGLRALPAARAVAALCALAAVVLGGSPRASAAQTAQDAAGGVEEITLAADAIVHDEGLAYRTNIPLVRPNERDDSGRSLSRLFEDDVELGPRGVSHAKIRAEGRGAFSHWGETFYFSSSDGSDPRTNGRTYLLRIGIEDSSIKGLHRLSTLEMIPDGGWGWRLPLPAVFHAWVDDAGSPGMSRLLLLEDGVPLRRPHAPHSEIRDYGLGAYSHWRQTLYFSTSDNSDPRENGRRYEIALAPPPDHRFVDPVVPPPPLLEERLAPPTIAIRDGGSSLTDGYLRFEVEQPQSGLLYYWELDVAPTFDSASVHRRPVVGFSEQGLNPVVIIERNPDFSPTFMLPYRAGALAALVPPPPNMTSVEHLARRLGYGLCGEAAAAEIYAYVSSQIYRRDSRYLISVPDRALLSDRGLCGSTNALATALLGAAGFSARLVKAQNPRLMTFVDRGIGSHISAEVFIDGRWSIFDPWFDFHLPGVSWRDIQEGHPAGEAFGHFAYSVTPEELEARGLPADSKTVLLRHFAEGPRTLYAGFYQYAIPVESAEQEAALFSGEPRLIPDPPFEMLWPDDTLDVYVRVRGLRLAREEVQLMFERAAPTPRTVEATPWSTMKVTVDLRAVYDQTR